MDVGRYIPQIKVPVRARIVIITEAHAVTAMPEEPAPPAVDLRYAQTASALLSIHHTIFILYVFVSSFTILSLFSDKVPLLFASTALGI